MRARLSVAPPAAVLSCEPFFGVDPQLREPVVLPCGGGLVAGHVVFTVGGYYKAGLSATDVLCRTKEGRYYLAREVSRDRVFTGNGGRPAFALPRGQHWLRVKRLSLRAAVLLVTRDCAYSFRQDLYDAMDHGEEAR